MVQSTNERNPEHPWDDNLDKNKEFIQKFYKKSEDEINQQENDINVHQDEMQGLGLDGNGMINQTKITKVRKNSSGDITDIMVDNGNVFSINEAIMMAKDGLIEGVNVGRAKNDREYLRATPNDIESDNLDNLPTF